MQFPASTGQVARLLGVTEPKLAETVRRGRVAPPPIVAGRRLWDRDHIAQAADALGCSLARPIAELLADEGGEL